MRDFKYFLKHVQSGETLSFGESKEFQGLILRNEFEEADLVEVFKSLENRALTYPELKGFFEASKEVMIRLSNSSDSVDVCGTGGDNSGSFNVSTAAGLICAAAGLKVAKHGNRAASSLCGSADVLESLGVNIDLNKEQAEECLKKTGFVFMMAKNFHPAFRFAAGARKVYGKRTYFNFLGPLLNPAQAEYRLHGFSDISQAENLGRILIESGVKRAWLVHSEDNLDEISPAAKTQVVKFTPQASKTFFIDPEVLGFSGLSLVDIKGGNAGQNAQILKDILGNKGNESQKVCSLLNAAAALVVAGKANNIESGIELARHAVESGDAINKLNQVIQFR